MCLTSKKKQSAIQENVVRFAARYFQDEFGSISPKQARSAVNKLTLLRFRAQVDSDVARGTSCSGATIGFRLEHGGPYVCGHCPYIAPHPSSTLRRAGHRLRTVVQMQLLSPPGLSGLQRQFAALVGRHTVHACAPALKSSAAPKHHGGGILLGLLGSDRLNAIHDSTRHLVRIP